MRVSEEEGLERGMIGEIEEDEDAYEVIGHYSITQYSIA